MNKKRNIILLVLGAFLTGLVFSEDPVYLYVTYGQTKTAVQNFITAEDMRGASLAAEQLNEAGGVLGRKIELIDGVATSFDEVTEKAMAQVKADKITAVVGANTSNFSLIVGQLFQKAGIPMVSPIATNPDVTAIGNYVFRMCFTDPVQGALMADFATKDLGARRAVILKKVDSTFSTSVSDFFVEEFKREGEIIWTGEYLGDDNDFSEILTRVKELDPDVVFVPGHGQDSGRILNQAYTMGIRSRFLGADGWGKGALGIAGNEAAEGHYFVNHWHIDSVSEKSDEFIRRYREKYGEDKIAASAALAYDAVFLIVEAIERSGSLDRASLRDEIARTTGFNGITGSVSFDSQGDTMGKPGVILKYENGNIVFVKSIQPEIR